MLLEVTCFCGFQARGTEDEVVEQIQAHGQADRLVRIGGAEQTNTEVRFADPAARIDARPEHKPEMIG